MCYIDAEIRRERYKECREAGLNRAWSQRVRDFSNPHFDLFLRINGKRELYE